MLFEKLASAIRNNVVSGIQGYRSNTSFTLEQIEDDIVDARLQIIHQLSAQGTLPIKDLLLEINCILVDCKNIEKCSKCCKFISETPTMHFEVPLIYMGLGESSIQYIGSPDKQNAFNVYTSPNLWRSNKYRRRVNNKPFVYIDTTPNENGMYDCFVFNTPLLKTISIIAIFKDPRQLELYGCCDLINNDNFNSLNLQIKLMLTDLYIKYYRLTAAALLPNTQTTVV